jgi:hypothetical protein
VATGAARVGVLVGGLAVGVGVLAGGLAVGVDVAAGGSAVGVAVGGWGVDVATATVSTTAVGRGGWAVGVGGISVAAWQPTNQLNSVKDAMSSVTLCFTCHPPVSSKSEASRPGSGQLTTITLYFSVCGENPQSPVPL